MCIYRPIKNKKVIIHRGIGIETVLVATKYVYNHKYVCTYIGTYVSWYAHAAIHSSANTTDYLQLVLPCTNLCALFLLF